MKKFGYIILTLIILSAGSIINTNAATTTPVKKTVAQAKPASSAVYMNVSPVDVVDNASKYLNKNISFTAEFVAFTSLGLDYKPAFREGSKYIGILIRRPEITNNVVPLSEMKIFLSRELAEKNMDIDAGDKVKIEGKVFSTALGDPRVDVKKFTVITHKEKTKK